MLMIRRLLIIISIWTLLTSCEGILSGSGKVISSLDKSPIDNVRIKCRTKETHTDSLGNFEIEQFVGCPTGCPDLELILTKTGYETKYVNLTRENPEKMPIEGVTIELTPTHKAQADIWNNNIGGFLYYASMVIAGLGVITLVLLFMIKVSNRAIWFFAIFLGTIAIHYNFLADTFDFKILRPVTQFNPQHYFDPAWYKLSLPVGVIAFWTYYFRRLRKKTVG
ncbi:MAG: hypothetical protein ACK514_15495 [Bacteroidota bacterium]